MGTKKGDEPVAEIEGEADAGLPEADATEQDGEGWDAEGEHNTAVDRLVTMADELELSRGEMVFDVRDFLLDVIRARPKPWSATSQAEQRDVAAACEHAAKELVRKVVEAVAANGVDSIRVLLTKVNIAGDIVISGKVKTYDEDEEDRAVAQLHRAIGKHVMLTRASADDYADGSREAETDADEPDLGFEAGDDEPDE